MNKYTVYTEFMHSKTVYLTFNLKRMIFLVKRFYKKVFSDFLVTVWSHLAL